MADPPALSSYDALPYLGTSTPRTHPNHLATLATLHGMTPPPVTACRVLELGCAGGDNLIPMAYGLPGSEFTGIDLSAGQIAAGQAAIAELGLKNVALRQMDVMDLGAEFGRLLAP